MFKTVALVVVATFGFLFVQEGDGPDLKGVKCVVNGDRGVDANFNVEYGGGTVYFCCRGCVKKFKADQAAETPALSTKANHQLVVTGQFTQESCPLTGEALVAEHVANVGGVEVSFCCGDCITKIENAEGMEAKAEMVFGNEPFARGFAKMVEEEE